MSLKSCQHAPGRMRARYREDEGEGGGCGQEGATAAKRGAARSECQVGESDVDHERHHFHGEPSVDEGILAKVEHERETRAEQQGIDHMRHDAQRARLAPVDAAQVEHMTQHEQADADIGTRDVYCANRKMILGHNPSPTFSVKSSRLAGLVA